MCYNNSITFLGGTDMKQVNVIFEPELQVSALTQAQITHMFQNCKFDNSIELFELKNKIISMFGFNSNVISFPKEIIVNIKS